MIIVELQGRLGNQMFQYAFALSLSKIYGTSYFLIDKQTRDTVRVYFEPINFSNNKFVRRILNILYSGKQFEKVCQSGFKPPTAIESLLGNNKYYEGFFQSASFFSNDAIFVKNKFKIKKKYECAFEKKYSNLFKQKKVIAIHYRLGDYLTWGGDTLGGTDVTLPQEYYMNALKLIPNIGDYQVIVVTDDLKSIKNKVSFIDNKIIVSDEEIVDFQILLNADKLIISNSTFAWWAAYLNKKNAEVLAPELWLGLKINEEFPVEIIPPQFTKVAYI